MVWGLSLLAAAQGVFLIAGVWSGRGESGARWLKEGDSLEAVQRVRAGRVSGSLPNGSNLLLLVFDSHCAHSRGVIPIWREWALESDRPIQIAAVTSEPEEEGAGYLASFDWYPETWTVNSTSKGNTLKALSTRTPWIFLVDGEGTILAEGHGRQIRELAAEWPEFFQGRVGLQ